MTAGAVRIGNCVSCVGYRPENSPHRKWGIFRYPEVASRLALATKRAFHDLNRNDKLLSELDQDIRNGRIDADKLILSGFVPEIIHGRRDWLTFGIRYFNPPAVEAVDYRHSKEMIHSLDRGINRTIFLRLLGVEGQGYEELTPDLYSALLGRIGHEFSDPSFEKVSFFRVTNIPFDSMEKAEDGSLNLLLSRRMLRQEASRYTPKTVDLISSTPAPPPSGPEKSN